MFTSTTQTLPPSASRGLSTERLALNPTTVGLAQAELEEVTFDYMQNYEQFGTDVAECLGIQWMLADMATDIQGARLLVHDAAVLLEAAGRLQNGERASIACSMVRCFAGDTAVRHSYNVVQTFGCSGYIRGYEAEHLYRDARIMQIYEGTNQIQRTIVARDLIANGASV